MRNTFAYIWQFLLYYKYEALCIAISIVTLLGAVGVLVYDAGPIPSSADDHTALIQSSETELTSAQTGLWVDVAGAVKKAGIYELPPGSRIADAITKAGGLDTRADLEYFSKNINLAKTLADEEKIYIPSIAERPTTENITSLLSSADAFLVNVNTASQHELESLPGVGEVTAKNIIAARPIRDLTALTEQKLVSQSVFTKIEKLIRL